MALVAVAIGPGASARPAAAQTISPVDVVKSFIEAINNHDEAGLRQLMAPNFQDLEDPGQPDAEVVSADDFINEVIGQGIHCTYTSIEQIGPQTVVIDDVLTFSPTAPDAPHLPHPFTERATVTVVNGRVTLISEVLSAQTRQDLAALTTAAAPGMPATGAPDAFTAPMLILLVSGLMVLEGVRLLQKSDNRKTLCHNME